jgi:hypothetical protein
VIELESAVQAALSYFLKIDSLLIPNAPTDENA